MHDALDIRRQSLESLGLELVDVRRSLERVRVTVARLEAEFAESQRRFDVVQARLGDLIASNRRRDLLAREVREMAAAARRASAKTLSLSR